MARPTPTTQQIRVGVSLRVGQQHLVSYVLFVDKYPSKTSPTIFVPPKLKIKSRIVAIHESPKAVVSKVALKLPACI